MLKDVKRLGDFIVLVFITIVFSVIVSEGSDITEWSSIEWLIFGSMIWTFIRFGLELRDYCIDKLIERIKEEIKK